MKKVTLAAIIAIISFIGGIVFTRTYQYYMFEKPLLEQETDDIWINIKQGEELPYYTKTKDEVMKMLPKPDIDAVYTIRKNDSIYQNEVWLRRYWEELLSSDDSVKYMSRVQWNNMPDENKPRLLILFEKKDSTWIVRECIQWHPDKVFVD